VPRKARYRANKSIKSGATPPGGILTPTASRLQRPPAISPALPYIARRFAPGCKATSPTNSANKSRSCPLAKTSDA